MPAKKIHANIIHCESLKKAISYDERTKKEILFMFPFVDDGIIGPSAKFSWDGIISSVDAYCNKSGADDTIIDIETISPDDFKQNIDSWKSILLDDKKITIKAGDMNQDNTYEISAENIKKDSLFRVNFISTGNKGTIDNTRIQGLTVQININITD